MKSPADSLSLFLFEHLPLRGEIVRLDAVWQHVSDRHDYPRIARHDG